MAISSFFNRPTEKNTAAIQDSDLRNCPLAHIIEYALKNFSAERKIRILEVIQAMQDPAFAAEMIKAQTGTIRSNSDIFLRWAAANGELETMKYLHQNGADLSVMNGACAYHAAKNGHLPILQWLHEQGHLIAHARPCMNMAAHSGDVAIMSFIHGIAPAAIEGETVLHAAINGQNGALVWLRDHDADLLHTTAEKAAANALGAGKTDTLDWMLSQNLPVNIESWSGDAQTIASSNGHLSAMQWLERHKQPLKHDQIICIAANNGHEDIVKWCHERGARINLNEARLLLKSAEKNKNSTIAAIMREQISRHGNTIVADALSTETTPPATGLQRLWQRRPKSFS
jgi:ankyrin repeat protein